MNLLVTKPLKLLALSLLFTWTFPERTVDAQVVNDGVVLNTKYGKVRGARRANAGAEFLGIPYAQPPLGKLRWREPMAVKPWSGVRDARTFGAPCAQPVLGDWNRHDSKIGREDCLFLNVITPDWPAKKRLPVMFWIHGGVNAGGTASSSLYKDGTLISHGVILVTVNYRLGIFGFLSHPELTRESAHHASGNYGLMDQIAALRWVRDNIERFGGDPNNVTVFGQSAGAQDTSLLMASPLAKGLFHKAIIQSGSALNPPCPPLTQSEQFGARVASLLKAPSAESLKYLRELSTEKLLVAVATQDPKDPPLLSPNIDGWVLPNSPIEVFFKNQQAAIPMIIGTTTREFGFSAPFSELRKFIRSITGGLAEQALALYGLANDGEGSSDPIYGSTGDQWFSDLIFRCPVSTQADLQLKTNRAVYQYEFAHAIPGHESEGPIHGSELPYVFGVYSDFGYLSGNFKEADHALGDLMQSYWTNFVTGGNPNEGSIPLWPEFGTSQSFIRILDDGHVVIRTGGLRKNYCELLREVLKRQLTLPN